MLGFEFDPTVTPSEGDFMALKFGDSVLDTLVAHAMEPVSRDIDVGGGRGSLWMGGRPTKTQSASGAQF